MACLNEVHVSLFVDRHASAIKLPAETTKNVWLRRLAGLLSRRTRFHPRPVHVGICIGLSDTGTHWDTLGRRILSQISPWGIFIGQTGAGAADSIQSSPYEVCVEKTDTRTSDSIADQSMWDLFSTNWHCGSGFRPRPVYVGCASDKVALRQVLLRVIRFPLVNTIPSMLPLIHPPTWTLYVHNFSNWLRR